MGNESDSFNILNSIDVRSHIEKKNGLSYLPWAWAWAEAKKRFPQATYTVYETVSGCFYFTDGKTCWVKTGVTINGLEHIEYLPVMDYANKSIPLEKVTSFDVNKAIQRSLTKALARHGLGLYVYAGEDLPEAPAPEPAGKEPIRISEATAEEARELNITLEKVAAWKHKPLAEVTEEDLRQAISTKRAKSNG